MSGFYKLIQSSLHAAERSGYFRSARLDENVQKITKDYETHQNASNDEEQAARLDVARSFQNFLHEVLAESSGKTGELRAASLSLLLEAPEGLLSLKDLVQPLCSMLELGLQHSPMAETGLRVLETWLTNRREELLPALPECVRSLRPYLDRGDGLSEDSEIDRNEAMAMFDIDENTRSGSIAEWRFEKRMEKQALEQRSNSEEKILLMRILRLLGSLGSYSHFLVNSLEEDERSSTDQNRDSSILWDSTMRISIDLPLYASAISMSVSQTVINFFIPSGSGQALATLPVMLPLGESLGLTRQITILAFQIGDGLSNLINPTLGGLIAMLSMCRVPIDRWIRFIFPILISLFIIAAATLIIAVAINYN